VPDKESREASHENLGGDDGRHLGLHNSLNRRVESQFPLALGNALRVVALESSSDVVDGHAWKGEDLSLEGNRTNFRGTTPL
jgi:hypothetical protein